MPVVAHRDERVVKNNVYISWDIQSSEYAEKRKREQAQSAQAPAIEDTHEETEPEFDEECYIPDYQENTAALDDVPEPREAEVEEPNARLYRDTSGMFNLDMMWQGRRARDKNRFLLESCRTAEETEALLQTGDSTTLWGICAEAKVKVPSEAPREYLIASYVAKKYPEYAPAQEVLNTPYLEDVSEYLPEHELYARLGKGYRVYRRQIALYKEKCRKNKVILSRLRTLEELASTLKTISVAGIFYQAKYERVRFGGEFIANFIPSEDDKGKFALYIARKLIEKRAI